MIKGHFGGVNQVELVGGFYTKIWFDYLVFDLIFLCNSWLESIGHVLIKEKGEE